MTTPCIVTGCTSTTTRRIKGACMMHDTRLRTHGQYGPAGRMRSEWHRTCEVTECDSRAQFFGLCSVHGRRLRLYGDPTASAPPKPKRTCTVDGCDGPHWARDYCRRHYKRWKANGTPDLLTPEQIFWRHVIVGRPDDCWIWTAATLKGYGRGRTAAGGYFYAHRRSYEMAHGTTLTADVVIRHRCDNPPCVNPAHLEAGTQADNVQDMVDRGRGHWQKSAGLSEHRIGAA